MYFKESCVILTVEESWRGKSLRPLLNSADKAFDLAIHSLSFCKIPELLTIFSNSWLSFFSLSYMDRLIYLSIHLSTYLPVYINMYTNSHFSKL